MANFSVLSLTALLPPPPLSLSLIQFVNLFIYLLFCMYFNIVGTNTHQPKIIDLQQFTNVNYQYYS